MTTIWTKVREFVGLEKTPISSCVRGYIIMIDSKVWYEVFVNNGELRAYVQDVGEFSLSLDSVMTPLELAVYKAIDEKEERGYMNCSKCGEETVDPKSMIPSRKRDTYLCADCREG